MLHGKAKEVDAGEVPGSRERGEKAVVCERKIVGPELVAGRGEQAQENTARFRSRTGTSGVAACAQDADECIFRQRTSGPALDRDKLFKKTERGGPVGVISVSERDQYIGIEKLDDMFLWPGVKFVRVTERVSSDVGVNSED